MSFDNSVIEPARIDFDSNLQNKSVQNVHLIVYVTFAFHRQRVKTILFWDFSFSENTKPIKNQVNRVRNKKFSIISAHHLSIFHL
jgi:hypothetical protein